MTHAPGRLRRNWPIGLALVLLARSPLWADPAVESAQRGGFASEVRAEAELDPRLKMSVVPQFQTLRGQAPLNCFVRFQWQGAGLLEGRALFDIYGGDKYIGSWLSPEVALNDQVFVFPLMLPPAPLNSGKTPYTVQVLFQTETGLIRLDPRDLAAEPIWSRRYLVGIVVPAASNSIGGFTATEGPPLVEEVFQLARFHREREAAAEFNTSSTPIAPADVPIEPLRLTAFDLLIVSAEALRELTDPQVESIVRWTKAGGRLCLIANSTIPASQRPAWGALVNESGLEPRIRFDEEGRARGLSAATRLRIAPGVGRGLVLLESAAVDQPEWLDDMEWIFGVQRPQAIEIARTGRWEAPPVQKFGVNYERVRPFAGNESPAPVIRKLLMPRNVHGVAVARVVFILSMCLLLIGPVDYIVLGRLGMRRWTWALLPVVALGTTWITVRMSQASLGDQNLHRSMSVVDLSTSREPVRVSRFDLEFAATEHVRRVARQGVMRIDFEPRTVGLDMFAEDQQQLRSAVAPVGESNEAPVRYVGSVPGSYEVVEPLRQWSPRLFRETSFGADSRIDSAVLSKIDWTAISVADWEVDGRKTIAAAVRNAAPDARVLLRTKLSTYDCNAIDETGPDNEAAGKSDAFQRLMEAIAAATSQWSTNAENEPVNFFSMVYQRAPTCGPDFEDFAWIDPADENEAVLLIGLGGEDSVIYRYRLTREGD
jgi:hypothetical protein